MFTIFTSSCSLIGMDLRSAYIIICFSCMFSTVQAQPCGGSLEASGQEQELVPPGLGGTLDCRWVIRANSGDGYVRLTVESVNLPETDGCIGDHLEVWMDGIINGEGEVKKFCGRVTDSLLPLLSSGQRILVRYISDGRAEGTENNFLLTYIEDEEIAPSLLWTDRNPTDGRSRLNSLAADPHTYLQTGSISTRFFFDVTPARWTALANDRRNRSIFWADGLRKNIVHGSIGNHASGRVVFQGTSTQVEGIAVDWMAKNVYFTDAIYNWIFAVNYDVTVLIRLISTGLDHPRGIAVHPSRSILFWTDCGENPRIERSSLAGRSRRVIVSNQLSSPNGITVDFSNERIYWTNSGPLSNTVESALFDGGDRQTLFAVSSFEAFFFHLTSYRDYIFVADRNRLIRCARKSSPGEEYFSLQLPTEPLGITVYDTEVQPIQQSPCRSNPCTHFCVGALSQPQYRCLCPDGHKLLPDRRTCRREPSIAAPQLFIATQTKLCRWPSNFPSMDIPSNYDMSCFLTGRQHVVAMAVDVEDEILFFSDIIAKMVASVELQEDAKIKVIAGATSSVEGIAVDWVSNNVYWTENDDEHSKLSMSTYDGQHQVDIITTGINRPRAIAIDPSAKFLFWGEFGLPAQIERADLDGQNRRVILEDELNLPNGFALDTAERKLYFADAATGTIQIMGYDGQERNILLTKSSPDSHNFFGMTLFQDYIMWTEFGEGNGMYVANRNSKEFVREHLIPHEAVFAITMYSEYTQPSTADGPCSEDNGGCDQICLPSTIDESGKVCRCSFGFSLDDDGMTCSSKIVENNFALFPDTYLKKVFQVDLTDSTYEPNALPLGQMRNPIAVAYDPQEEKVYWSDVIEKTISRAGLDGSNKQVIVASDIETVDGLTLDPVLRLIFWTDIGKETISASKLDGHHVTTLISSGLVKPRAIALHSSEGYMYWTDWGSNAKIERSYMDGSGRETLFNTGLGWPNGLVVDASERNLYWCDAELERIERSSLNGENRQLLINFESSVHPFGIAVFRQNIFWTDWQHTSLLRADKVTGRNNVTIGSSKFRRPNELHIYSSEVEIEGYADCESNNGGCGGICLSSVTGFTCRCGDGMLLEDDGVTCSEIEEEGLQCPLEFMEGELEESCTGAIDQTCAVNCWTGFTRRVTSVKCLPSGSWDVDLATVCDISLPDEPPEPEELIVTIEKSSSTPLLGDRVELSCSASEEDATLTWYKDGNRLATGVLDDLFVSDSEVLILDFAYIHQGQYACSAVGRDGEFAETIFSFWLPLRLLFATYPTNITVTQFADHILHCSAMNRLHTIRWEKNGAPLVQNEHVFKEFGDDLVISDATLMEEGLYTCVLYEGSHRIRQVTAHVDINVHQEVAEVCGTITAEEAISIEASAGTDGTFRIVGGRKAIHGSAPWMARLYDRHDREHFCGGSIVNNFWVITAAHCITEKGIGADNLMIRLGDYDTRLTDESEVLLGVDEIITPDGFDEGTFDEDIALIKLITPVYVFTDYIRPICVPNITVARRSYKIGNKGKITGWGRVAELGPLPRYLTEVSLPLVGKRRCRASTNYTVTTNMFCAGYPRESGDACRGDSGGPFAVQFRDRWYLLGIVSWGEGCGQEGKYGFYTRVSKFLDWIHSHINPTDD